MHRGFIKLHRRMLDWEWASSPETFTLFIYLLLNANFEDKKWRGIDIKRGQIVTGRASLAEKTGLSQRCVRTSLERLKTTSEVTIKTTNKYSIISITNWDLYQCSDQLNANKRPTNDQQTTTPKECKESKEYSMQPEGLEKRIESSAKKKGKRLPDDWVVTEELGEWAMGEGLTHEQVCNEIYKFRDYWKAKAGASGLKLDWDATFRNWIRNANERKKYD